MCALPICDPRAMPSDPRAVLADVFGYASFRGDQEAVVDHVVAGGDALVLMPTGGGKSLCYQIPALCRPGVGIVVSPGSFFGKGQERFFRVALVPSLAECEAAAKAWPR